MNVIDLIYTHTLSVLYIHRAMMMTACDLSAIAKPWEIQSKVTQMFEGLSCAAFLITTQHFRTCGFQQSTLKTEEDVRGIAISME